MIKNFWDLPQARAEYYSLEEMAEILLTDKDKILAAMEDRESWEESYLYLLDNPMIVQGERLYYCFILAMLDELINMSNRALYNKNYQDRVISIEEFRLVALKMRRDLSYEDIDYLRSVGWGRDDCQKDYKELLDLRDRGDEVSPTD